MITDAEVERIPGAAVYGADGEKIGKAGAVYRDDQTGRPEWVTVQTGLFGTSESFVPLAQAQFDGDDLRVPYDKSKVKDAPRVDDEGHLDISEEDRLFEHYGVDDASAGSDTRDARDVRDDAGRPDDGDDRGMGAGTGLGAAGAAAAHHGDRRDDVRDDRREDFRDERPAGHVDARDDVRDGFRDDARRDERREGDRDHGAGTAAAAGAAGAGIGGLAAAAASNRDDRRDDDRGVVDKVEDRFDGDDRRDDDGDGHRTAGRHEARTGTDTAAARDDRFADGEDVGRRDDRSSSGLGSTPLAAGAAAGAAGGHAAGRSSSTDAERKPRLSQWVLVKKEDVIEVPAEEAQRLAAQQDRGMLG